MRLREEFHPKRNLVMIRYLSFVTRWSAKVGKVLPKVDETIALDLANVHDIVSQSSRGTGR